MGSPRSPHVRVPGIAKPLMARHWWRRTTNKGFARVESRDSENTGRTPEGISASACGAAGGNANGRFCSTASGSLRPGIKTLAGNPRAGQGSACSCRTIRGVAAFLKGIAQLCPYNLRFSPSGPLKLAIASGNFGFSSGSRAARVQAGDVRHARRGRGARHRAGRDAQTDREILRQAGGRTADAVPAHPAEHDPRPFPAAKGPEYVDDPPLGIRQRRRKRRRFRPARNFAGQIGFERDGRSRARSSNKRKLWE